MYMLETSWSPERGVAFIDFGIVGHLPAVSGAVIFFQATASRDYTYGRIPRANGGCRDQRPTLLDVDDLQSSMHESDRLDPDIVVSETDDGNGIAATLADQQVLVNC